MDCGLKGGKPHSSWPLFYTNITNVRKTSEDSNLSFILNLSFLHPDNPVLSFLLSGIWHLRFRWIQIFRVRRHAWSYSGAVKDRQPPRWNEAALLPQGSHGAPLVPRRLLSSTHTSSSMWASKNVWPSDTRQFQSSVVGDSSLSEELAVHHRPTHDNYRYIRKLNSF